MLSPSDSYALLTSWPPSCLCDQHGEAQRCPGTRRGKDEQAPLDQREGGMDPGQGEMDGEHIKQMSLQQTARHVVVT